MDQHSYRDFDPKTLSTRKTHGLLLGCIGPRPIAWASTVDDEGRPNLAPFSYFGVFSSDPPILIFSPSRRVRDNTEKDSLHNAQAVKEVTINICPYELARQMVITAGDWDTGINEADVAGLQLLPSAKVKPGRVAGAIAHYECKVQQLISLGDQGGAGTLIICEVVHMHFDSKLMDENNYLKFEELDLIGRMGGNWYTRAKMGQYQMDTPSVVEGKLDEDWVSQWGMGDHR